MVEAIVNRAHQRAGLLAIITSILQTSSCETTKEAIIQTLKYIFSEYPVEDELEETTISTMNDTLKSKVDEAEEELKKMFDEILDILKK
jgi:RAB protein geranylgeranyltransferase component A